LGFNEPQRHREHRGGEEEIGREKRGVGFLPVEQGR
jgi:hypothetical protein